MFYYFTSRQHIFAKSILPILTFILTSMSANLFAAPQQTYLEHPIFLKMLDELETEQQFDPQALKQVFQTVYRQDNILKAMSRPAEKTKTWGEYKPIFVNNLGIERGLKFWAQHAKTLEKAAQEFQVPEAIIVAIIGVETRYGHYKGKHKVIEALATLAFDHPPRSDFFYGQLKQYLILSRNLNWNPHDILGSYAGAMGYAQFIPSSYINLAVDYDGDDKPDLINSPQDAIGSIANYFRHHEWQPNRPVLLKAKKVQQTTKAMQALLNKPLEPTTTLQAAANQGLILDPAISGDFLVRPYTFINAQSQEEIWFGLKNFFVITEYNHSKLYARAVYELAAAIEQQYTRKPILSVKEDTSS